MNTPYRFSHYRILSELGQGGMSIVFKALDEHLQREVALKVLHPFLEQNAEIRARLYREAKIIAQLQHPHIVQIYDYSGENTSPLFLVSELVEGSTLRQFAEKFRPWQVPEIGALVVWELSLALDYAHEKGIIHRDLKPENIMVRQDGILKLMDFGIAQLRNQSSLTQSGTLLGSPAHLSPELIEGKELTPLSDIYSMGTLLYWLTTGQLPFQANSPHALLKMIVEDLPPPPQQFSHQISNELAHVIEKALKKEPQQRFLSAKEMANALQQALQATRVNTDSKKLQYLLAHPPEAFKTTVKEIHHDCLQRAEHLLPTHTTEALSLLNRILADEPENEKAGSLLSQGHLRIHTQKNKKRWFFICGLVALLGIAIYGFMRKSSKKATLPVPVISVPPSSVVTPVQPPQEDRPILKEPLPSSPSAPLAPPMLTLLIQPFADVYIDGKLLEKDAKVLQLQLSPGKHSLRFEHQFAATTEKTINIEPGKPLPPLRIRLSKTKPSFLIVESDIDADVAVGGLYRGTSFSSLEHPIIVTLPESTYSIESEVVITRKNYLPYAIKVQLIAGKTQRLKVNMKYQNEVPHKTQP